MYFYFLEFILGPLNEFNTTFQAGSSKIGVVHDHMVRLLRKFLAKFVKASVISQHIITAVPFDDRASQIDDSKLAIGLPTRTYLHDQEDSISPSLMDRFFKKVRCFYEATTRKMLKKFPFKDSTLKDMAVLNPDNKGKISSDCVSNLALRFPNVVLEDERERLMDEFLDYQLTPAEELPSKSDGEDTENKIDHFWGDLAQVKEPFENDLRFGVLCRLMKACLVLSVSNADSERTFSMLKKIQTEGRSELGNDTICALLCAKLNQHGSCFQYAPSTSVLKEAKSATLSYVQEKKNMYIE